MQGAGSDTEAQQVAPVVLPVPVGPAPPGLRAEQLLTAARLRSRTQAVLAEGADERDRAARPLGAEVALPTTCLGWLWHSALAARPPLAQVDVRAPGLGTEGAAAGGCDLVSGSLGTKATWGRPFHRKYPAFTGQNRPPVTSPDSSSTRPET